MDDIEFNHDKNVFLVPKDRLQEFGKDIAEILVEANMAQTKSEARRSIEQGAVKIGDRIIKHKFSRLCGDGKNFFIVEPK